MKKKIPKVEWEAWACIGDDGCMTTNMDDTIKIYTTASHAAMKAKKDEKVTKVIISLY
jgi:hypothetical protein